jgi:hypothetical protein
MVCGRALKDVVKAKALKLLTEKKHNLGNSVLKCVNDMNNPGNILGAILKPKA